MKTISSPSRKKLESQATKIIISFIKKLLKSQPQVTLALPGGSSVSGIFTLLKKSKIPWSKIKIFLVDERLVHPKNKDSNYGLIRKYFPPSSIHAVPLKNSTESYKKTLLKYSGHFDIVLLSAGEDGHIASLFPNHKTIRSKENYFIKTSTSPKSPKSRVTASKSLLLKSKVFILLFFGENKKQAYKNFLNPKISLTKCPAKLVKKIKESYILTDLD
jgi:6-phosphogluconolactonase